MSIKRFLLSISPEVITKKPIIRVSIYINNEKPSIPRKTVVIIKNTQHLH